MDGFVTPIEAGLLARNSGYQLDPHEILAWLQENPSCVVNGMIHKAAFAKRFLQVRFFTSKQPKKPSSYDKLKEQNRILRDICAKQDQKIFALERELNEFENARQMTFFGE